MYRKGQREVISLIWSPQAHSSTHLLLKPYAYEGWQMRRKGENFFFKQRTKCRAI